MTPLLRRIFSVSFLLFIAVPLCSAQNLMTRRYLAASAVRSIAATSTIVFHILNDYI